MLFKLFKLLCINWCLFNFNYFYCVNPMLMSLAYHLVIFFMLAFSKNKFVVVV